MRRGRPKDQGTVRLDSNDIYGRETMDRNTVLPPWEQQGKYSKSFSFYFHPHTPVLASSALPREAQDLLRPTPAGELFAINARLIGRAAIDDAILAADQEDERHQVNMDIAMERSSVARDNLLSRGVGLERVVVENVGDAEEKDRLSMGPDACNPRACRVDVELSRVPTQIGAVHEAGHQTGSKDEYGEGGSYTPDATVSAPHRRVSRSDMVVWAHANLQCSQSRRFRWHSPNTSAWVGRRCFGGFGMKTDSSSSRKPSIASMVAGGLAVLLTACTGGYVADVNRESIAGLEVTMRWLDDDCVWQERTDAIAEYTDDWGGTYQYNPFRPDTGGIDQSRIVPPGPARFYIEDRLFDDTGAACANVFVDYDEGGFAENTCMVTWNHERREVPCTLFQHEVRAADSAAAMADEVAFCDDIDDKLQSYCVEGRSCAWSEWNRNEINWGMCVVDNPLTNYLHFVGYQDADGDGLVEEVETAFDLEDLHCSGKDFALILRSSTHCGACPTFLAELRLILDDIHAANSVVVGIVDGVDTSALALTYWRDRHGLDLDYVLPEVNLTGEVDPGYPRLHCIDLDTMKISGIISGLAAGGLSVLGDCGL